MQIAQTVRGLSDSELEEKLSVLKKWELTRLSKLVNQTSNKKYPHSRIPIWKKLGVTPLPTDAELSAFFKVVDNPMHRLMFRTQMILCLRPSELVELEWADIDFDRQTVRVHSKKQKEAMLDIIPMPTVLVNELRLHQTAYADHNSPYVFFGINYKKRGQAHGRSTGPLSVNYYRLVFNEYKKKAGISDEYGRGRNGWKLTRFHLHTFRHLGTTRTWDAMKEKNIKNLSQLTRHRDLNVLFSFYLHTGFDELRNTMERAWGDPVLTSLGGVR